MQSLRMLLSETIDYAGLFPPASLPMSAAVRNYAAYRASEHRWLLGRFVLPVARLEEFEAAAQPYLSIGSDAEPWRLSALVGTALDLDLDAIHAFNHRHAATTVIDTLELKASSIEEIETAARLLPPSLVTYVEIPVHEDPRALIAAIAQHGMRAKVRTGGVTPDLFPSPDDLVRFMEACVAEGVPFKATAGLHHALRGEYRLTYEPDSSTATMFGFLNVFVAAAFLEVGLDAGDALHILTETDLDAFRFDDERLFWRDRWISTDALLLPQRLAIAFGSCSFDEPVDDLKAFNLL